MWRSVKSSFVVILGWGGLFLGSGGCFHGQSVSSWSKGHSISIDVPHCWVCPHFACVVACHVVAIMVGGGYEWLVMVMGGG